MSETHYLSTSLAMLLTSNTRQLLKHIQGHSPRNSMLIPHLKLPLSKLGPDVYQSMLLREMGVINTHLIDNSDM